MLFSFLVSSIFHLLWRWHIGYSYRWAELGATSRHSWDKWSNILTIIPGVGADLSDSALSFYVCYSYLIFNCDCGMHVDCNPNFILCILSTISISGWSGLRHISYFPVYKPQVFFLKLQEVQLLHKTFYERAVNTVTKMSTLSFAADCRTFRFVIGSSFFFSYKECNLCRYFFHENAVTAGCNSLKNGA